MSRGIITLDNSKYRQDYNKYFSIGDYIGNSTEISNKEFSDEIFKKIFEIANTLVVIFPKDSGKIDRGLSSEVRNESGRLYYQVIDILKSEKVKLHLREFHNKEKVTNDKANVGGDCKEAVHYFNFESYQEIEKFLVWEKLDDEANIIAYTTLTNPKASVDPNRKIQKTIRPVQLPIIELSEYEKIYLEEIHIRFLKGEDYDIKPFAVLAKLWRTPPQNFSPNNIDSNLLLGGKEITPLGIYQVDRDSDVVKYIDPIMYVIQDMIHESESLSRIHSQDVQQRIPQITMVNLLLTFRLIHRMGEFTTGMSWSLDSMELTIGNEIAYSNILYYKSLQDYYGRILNSPKEYVIDNEKIELGGLIVNDSTDWFEHSINHIRVNGAELIWWNKLPSGIPTIGTLELLEQKLNRDGYFEIFYCSDNYAVYRAEVVRFATEGDYNSSNWKKEFPQLELYDSIFDYTDERGDKTITARIVFIARLIEEVDPKVPISNFVFPSEVSPPYRNNLQPFIRIDKQEYREDEVDKYEINRAAAPPIFISENVKGVIGVKEYAKELSEVLINLKNETGLMVGLFGRWGRGKTFFWKEMKKYLKSDEKRDSFIFSEFHAWKYQDTPASWAYLYEGIVKSCLEYSDLHPIFRIKRNVLRVNLKKHGYWPIILFTISFLFSISWYFIIPFSLKLDVAGSILIYIVSGAISIGSIIGAHKIYSEHLPKAINLFHKYSEIVSFKDLLGLQSEIQGELIKVISATIPSLKLIRSKKGRLRKGFIFKRINSHRLSKFQLRSRPRILLFVDDIDRCNEDKIIQIIDSLKVMLEDVEISKRMVVLTAVDERVLKRAIKHKYFDLVQRSCANPNDDGNTLEVLSREYMDKLFIAGIKLSSLSENEKLTVFNAFSMDKGNVNSEVKAELVTSSDQDDDSYREEEPQIDLRHLDNYAKERSERKNPIIFAGNEKFEIEYWEYMNLRSSLSNLKEATPRSIRIYYYRYMLAKRIIKHKFAENSSERNIWDKLGKDGKQVLTDLIIYAAQEPLEMMNHLRAETIKSGDFVQISLFDKEYEVRSTLALELFDLVETVVPY